MDKNNSSNQEIKEKEPANNSSNQEIKKPAIPPKI